MIRAFIFVFGLQLFASAAEAPAPAAPKRPNIVIILADDVGVGDLSCNGATKYKTPSLDMMAASGINFRAGYSAGSTCTPSRFSLLTGNLPWRQKGTGILPGDAALILPTADQATLPSRLKAAGYTTAAIGKWHLGLGDGKQPIDWNKEVIPGPREVGFDYSFIMPATADRTPCVFLRNGKVVDLDPADPITVSYKHKVGDDPTGKENPELLEMGLTAGHDGTIVNGISRIGFMSGGKKARWIDQDIADTLTGQAVQFIKENKDKPFFVYLATHDTHVPRAPHSRFVGKSGLGPRGDSMLQLDWTVGAVMAALVEHKLLDNTLVIFSSDNGAVLGDGYADQAQELLGDHKPSGPWKGGKYSNFEGGTRVPFLATWSGRIKPGVSDAIIGQVDLYSSLCSLAGAPALTAGIAVDSLDQKAALLGDSPKGREWLLGGAGPNTLRVGEWKLIPGGGKKKGRSGSAPGAQLFNLAADPGETKDLSAAHPDKVKEMMERFEQLKSQPQTR
ncbi:MAG: hypothetical protein RL095_2838 [Verrucomicrobiota bacterium]